MPTPRRPCAAPGCPRLVTRGSRCPDHRRQAQRRYDDHRGPDRQWYGKPGWRRFRAQILAARPMCERCAEQGVRRAGSHVHHVVPRKVAPCRAMDPLNVTVLCGPCHNVIEPRGR